WSSAGSSRDVRSPRTRRFCWRASEKNSRNIVASATRSSPASGRNEISLVAQGIDRIQQGGLSRRIVAEENPDRGRKHESAHDSVDREQRWPSRKGRDALGSGDAAQNARHAADRAEQHRLDQELQQDVRSLCADRHPNADFAGALRHRHEQDIHYSDSTDEQRNRCDRREQERHHAAAGLGRLRNLAEVADVEVVVFSGTDVMPQVQRRGYLIDRRRNQFRASHLDEDYLYDAGELEGTAEGADYAGVGVIDRRRIRVGGIWMLDGRGR